ncbi:MAG: erythromycin esterase [Gammaproteobacteria bacterium 39-13]|nr:erythromycin esterase family protein [Gammaproteobacteria bacterium]OJV91379.1 MAG: erythromycin esterase [Gammaproteobacteria bacterium 39-13]
MSSDDALEKLISVIEAKSLPLSMNDESSYASLLEKISDARLVLIGEATHGTQEFYQIRAEITKQLISKKGFMAVAIEGDWPDAYQVNRYLKGIGDKNNPELSLKSFSRFPRWMWRNTIMLPFLLWLRAHNDKISMLNKKIGFYGLDLYSLHSSMNAVIEYLEKIDPNAAMRAKERYACFDHLNIDPEAYGYLTSAGIKKSCVDKAMEQLFDLQHNALHLISKDGIAAEEEYFYATQNARLVKNAEIYYRSHFEGRVSSWNIRDTHMAETLSILSNHLEKCFNKPAKVIVWAHNSHVGDARATEMSEQGEVNIGQLMREQYAEDSYLIGFSTYEGFVTAASKWDGKAMQKSITPGLKGSYEELFHHVKHRNFILNLTGDEQLEHYLHIQRLQRAIGVIYRPETERSSHYFFTRLPYQFDAMIHIDQTTAVIPLDINTLKDISLDQ